MALPRVLATVTLPDGSERTGAYIRTREHTGEIWIRFPGELLAERFDGARVVVWDSQRS